MAEADPIKQAIKAGDCILFATADWDEPYWTNKQHCAKELTRLGWRVLYVESMGLRAPKAGSKRDLKRLWSRLRKGLQGLFFGAVKRDKNLWVLSPLVVPGAHSHKWFGRLNQFFLQLALQRHVTAKTFTMPLIWTYHPFMLSAIENIKHGPLLYHCVDDLAALPGIDESGFKRAECKLLKSSDVVFATTQSLLEKCQRINLNTHYLSNVVDAEHFSNAFDTVNLPNDIENIPEPRLVYHGVLSDFKLDFRLLYDAAKLRPEWQWILIGDEREGQHSSFVVSLKSLPNVHFLGYKNYNDLPKYLSGMSVGLLPTLVNPYTDSMFPMKFYEYVASGLRVVSTPIKFTMNIGSLSLRVAGSVLEFVDSIQCHLNDGKLTKDEAESIIGKNTWSKRTIAMLSKLYEN